MKRKIGIGLMILGILLVLLSLYGAFVSNSLAPPSILLPCLIILIGWLLTRVKPRS